MHTGGQSFSGNTWAITSGGGDIWDKTDSFRYAWQSITDDGGISAEVLSQTYSDRWAKAGVMIREDAGRDAPYYFAAMTPGYGVVVQYRAIRHTDAAGAGPFRPLSPPAYLKVARVGDVFTAYTSPDGVTWTPMQDSALTIPMSGTVLAGLAVSPHDGHSTSTATFSGVQVVGTTHLPSVLNRTATPELGSGELLLTGLLPLGVAMLYRRRARRRARSRQDGA